MRTLLFDCFGFECVSLRLIDCGRVCVVCVICNIIRLDVFLDNFFWRACIVRGAPTL